MAPFYNWFCFKINTPIAFTNEFWLYSHVFKLFYIACLTFKATKKSMVFKCFCKFSWRFPHLILARESRLKEEARKAHFSKLLLMGVRNLCKRISSRLWIVAHFQAYDHERESGKEKLNCTSKFGIRHPKITTESY